MPTTIICPKCGHHTRPITVRVFGLAAELIACINWPCGWAKCDTTPPPDPLIFGNAITPRKP